MNLVESIRKDLNLLEAPLELTNDPRMDYSRIKEAISQADKLLWKDRVWKIEGIYDTAESIEEFNMRTSSNYDYNEPFVIVFLTNVDEMDLIYFKDILADPDDYNFVKTKTINVI